MHAPSYRETIALTCNRWSSLFSSRTVGGTAPADTMEALRTAHDVARLTSARAACSCATRQGGGAHFSSTGGKYPQIGDEYMQVHIFRFPATTKSKMTRSRVAMLQPFPGVSSSRQPVLDCIYLESDKASCLSTPTCSCLSLLSSNRTRGKMAPADAMAALRLADEKARLAIARAACSCSQPG